MPIVPGQQVTPLETIPPGVSPAGPSTLVPTSRVSVRIDGISRPELDALVIEWLIVQRFDNVDLPPLRFMLGQDLQSFAVSADLRGQPTSVGVSGWSAAAGSAVGASATPVAADFDVPGGDSGASIGQATLGASVFTLASTSAGNPEEAGLQARTRVAAQARRFVSAHGRLGTLAEGLHAGSVVTLLGLGRLHSGRYRITALRRRFDTVQGPYTEFEALRNSIGRP